MTKSRDCSDVGTSQESGMHQSWRRQGVQLLLGNFWREPGPAHILIWGRA